jgi:probable phosphoglycerate mutase
MAIIYLMRHGESIVNRERRLKCKELDGDLSPLGREQAAKAGHWLMDKGITAIACSPFHRAQQTAQIIGDCLGIVPVTDKNLCEIDCGELEGRGDDEGWDAWRGVFRRWLACEWEAAFPGGESLRHAFERFNRSLAQIGKDETALLVTHGAITCSIVPYLCVNAAALQRTSGLDLDNTGFVVLETYDASRYICRAWNLVEHLEER